MITIPRRWDKLFAPARRLAAQTAARFGCVAHHGDYATYAFPESPSPELDATEIDRWNTCCSLAMNHPSLVGGPGGRNSSDVWFIRLSRNNARTPISFRRRLAMMRKLEYPVWLDVNSRIVFISGFFPKATFGLTSFCHFLLHAWLLPRPWRPPPSIAFGCASFVQDEVQRHFGVGPISEDSFRTGLATMRGAPVAASLILRTGVPKPAARQLRGLWGDNSYLAQCRMLWEFARERLPTPTLFDFSVAGGKLGHSYHGVLGFESETALDTAYSSWMKGYLGQR